MKTNFDEDRNITEIFHLIDNENCLNYKNLIRDLKSKMKNEFSADIESKSKLNCLLCLQKLCSKLDYSDFDTKILFNETVIELVPFINDNNILVSKIVIKIFKSLLKNSENVEFIIKNSLLKCLECDDWTVRYSSILVLKLAIEQRMDFFIEKINYTKKLIEALVIHSKDNSEKISTLAIEVNNKFILIKILVDLINKIPNYVEISNRLNSGMLNEIFKISNKKKTDIKSEIKKIIKSDCNLLNKVNNFESNISKSNEIYVDSKGFAFGIFPSNLLNEVDLDVSIEIRIYSLNKIKNIFEENVKNSVFLKFSSTFFNFILKLCNDKLSSISYIALNILNTMLSDITGLNITTSIHLSIPILIQSLGSNSIKVRENVKDIFDKIMMIIPTSQLIPYLVQSFKNENWILITESLNILYKIFSNLNSIYNDIDFIQGNYDVSIILEIIKLLNHSTPKVIQISRILIKLIGEKVLKNLENFLKTIELYVDDKIYKILEEIFYGKKEIRCPSFFFFGEVASDHLLNINKKIQSNLIVNEEENQNFNIYKKINNYEHFNNSNTDKIILDESSMIINDSLINNNFTANDNIQALNNYQNYKDSSLGQLKKNIVKSRLKRYNEKEELTEFNTFDNDYFYGYKPIENLSPLKNPDSVYLCLYSSLKSHLNWEKQFKSLDLLRNINYNHPSMMSRDLYYLNLILEEVVKLSSSVRTLLVKNSLLTLSEIFQNSKIDVSSKYELFFNKIITKILDKNEFISKEAVECLDKLLMNCDVTKASNVILETLTKQKDLDHNLVTIQILTKLIYYKEKEFVQNKNFNQSINYVTDLFHKYKNNTLVIKALSGYFKSLKTYFNDDLKFEKFLSQYYSLETLNNLLSLTYK